LTFSLEQMSFEKGAHLKRGVKEQLKRLVSLIPKARWKRVFLVLE